MTGRNLALTGVPRGGTTLACRLLGRCRDTVSLFEPMDVAALEREDPAGAVRQVAGFYADTRHALLKHGRAPSKQRDGQVPDNPFDHERGASGRRRLQASLGMIDAAPQQPGFTLVVKHNAAFTALLPTLASRFETFAIVRNPLSVLASWQTVDLPVADGRIPAGERLDPILASRLDAAPALLERQLLVLAWFFGRYRAALPRERVLRYEDIVASGGAVLTDAAGLEGEPDASLEERNANSLYSQVDVAGLLKGLEARHLDWSPWYDREALHEVASRLAGATR